ncbi:MAG: type III pantothenate kinase [Clostridia bacterium]|nr:type III pantothenate kinase [Clostridia bacterium]
MILAIDIGNSNIVLGVFEDGKLLFTSRISTDISMTSDELAVMVSEIFDIRGIDKSKIDGASLSSVVPALTKAMTQAVELLSGKPPFVVAPGIKTGLNIRIDNPSSLGADLLTDCVAAVSLYKRPVIVIDMGTATTMTAVDRDKNILGVAIMPGVRTALNALTKNTAQLTQISIEPPAKAIGTNTIESMQSGIVYGNAAMLDGMIARFEKELGEEAFVVITGGVSDVISRHISRKVLHNPDLQLQGLLILYNKNVK